MKTLNKHNSGFAVVVAVGITAVMAILIAGIFKLSANGLRQAANTKHSTQAYYYASSALQTAQADASKKPAAYIIENQEIKDLDTDTNSIDSKWSVYALSGQVGSDYIIPYPGTGTVGKAEDNCNIKTTYTDTNNPCLWDKIYVGEQVAIPLYTAADNTGKCFNLKNAINVNGEKICNPLELELNKLQLKLRTPLKPDESMRFVLYFNTAKPETDSTIMHWEIVGEDVNKANTTYTLQAMTKINESTKNRYLTKTGHKTSNTEIYESFINTQLTNGTDKFIVLDASSYEGKDMNAYEGKIIDFLKNSSITYPISPTDDPPYEENKNWDSSKSGREIHKPVLKLSIIHALCATQECGKPSSESIPYLEYQIITDKPIGNSKKILRAEGYSGNFTQRLRKEIKQTEGGILNFVISD